MKLMNCFWALLFALTSLAQNNTGYWQQEVQYTMSVEMDVQTWQYKGSQELRYTNNSPDTLNHVFYHMYFNAFQPGSEMDVRSRTIADPDTRVGDRIASLSPSEVGYIRPTLLQQEGESISFEMLGTVLKVMLQKPILPGETTTLQMEWEAQVPIQVRRSGRNNDEGVALSMTQWYQNLQNMIFKAGMPILTLEGNSTVFGVILMLP